MAAGSDQLTFRKVSEYKEPDVSGQHLSLVIGRNLFQAALLDVVRNTYSAWWQTEVTHPSNALATFLSQEIITPEKLKRIQLSWLDPVYTLIPGAFYDKDKTPAYLKALFPENQLKNPVKQDRLRNFDIQNIYTLPEEISRQLDGLNNVHCRHAITHLLDTLQQQFRKDRGVGYIAHLADHILTLVIQDGRQLKFCNSFHCRTPEDVLYHIMLVLENQEFSPEKNELSLLGDFPRADKLYQMVKQQVGSIRTSFPAAGWKTAPVLQDPEILQGYLLLNQYLVT